MWNSRHAFISSRCAWCARVWTGQEWVEERRPQGRETYSQGICVECTSLHFAETGDRKRLNVEQHKMRPRQVAVRTTK